MVFTDVWGFDEDAVTELKKLERELATANMTEKVEK